MVREKPCRELNAVLHGPCWSTTCVCTGGCATAALCHSVCLAHALMHVWSDQINSVCILWLNLLLDSSDNLLLL